MSNTRNTSTVAEGLPARAAALQALGDVLRKRRPLDVALEATLNLPPRDAGFARAIASETLRRFGQIEALVRHFVPKTPAPHKSGPTLEILFAGTCELLFLNVPAHAAVDAANRLAQADSKAVHFKSLINAVLRRVSREGAAILAEQDAAVLNTPDWLWLRWSDAYGETITRKIAEAHAVPAPVDIVLKGDGPAPEGERLFGDVVRLCEAGRVDALRGFDEGAWWVQDAAATLPAHLLGAVRGQRVIDLCAAPGGKTMQLAAAGGVVTSVDREPERIARVRENLARTKLEATVVEADVRDFRPGEPAPFVLLDAPCTATGTIRRHPDLPWIKGASDVTLCEQGASELLDAAAEMVAPGGTLVFAVCSLEPEEGVGQADAFLQRNKQFARAKITAHDVFGMTELISAEGDLRTLPCHLADKGGMDGFFAARFRRS
ncbi:MAG: MFS transporter [Alphaproteobacteria bacterium]|nr:MFS transporter [Alphaproteobacteria bacterium]MBL6938917.1 MFS transporter [Alphaproteobacteria bacterium]MBL7099509.1 MFS transporter [Alphaproteobacteria bacterium]